MNQRAITTGVVLGTAALSFLVATIDLPWPASDSMLPVGCGLAAVIGAIIGGMLIQYAKTYDVDRQGHHPGYFIEALAILVTALLSGVLVGNVVRGDIAILAAFGGFFGVAILGFLALHFMIRVAASRKRASLT
jgi:hypothetical protein